MSQIKNLFKDLIYGMTMNTFEKSIDVLKFGQRKVEEINNLK